MLKTICGEAGCDLQLIRSRRGPNYDDDTGIYKLIFISSVCAMLNCTKVDFGGLGEVLLSTNASSSRGIFSDLTFSFRLNNNGVLQIKQDTQLSLTNRAMRLEVSQGHKTWYHSIC